MNLVLKGTLIFVATYTRYRRSDPQVLQYRADSNILLSSNEAVMV